MLQSFLITVLSAGLVTAHGQLKSFVVDGNAYPAFDPAFDYDAKYVSKRIEWGFAKGRGGVGPVERVDGKDVACRFAPLKEPGFAAPARAGSEISFKWLDWFQSHKGPVITYMGLLPENKDPYSAEFFKIDESAYDPKTRTWGTDVLMKNKNTRTVTIPSDLKPGTYIVRHEIISLHNALNDDYVKKSSGAQFYPNCINVEVTGSGTVSPPTVGKFPGAYKWDDKGILVNIFYMPNEYISPGGPVYKSTMPAAPIGAKPVVSAEGVLLQAQPEAYIKSKDSADKRWEGAVHSTDKAHPGGGGCYWEPGADPKTAKCTSLNTANKEYAGFAQPKQSPAYIDQAHMDRSIVKFGPIIKYLFDPTQPRMEERVKGGQAPKIRVATPAEEAVEAEARQGILFRA